MSLFVVYTPMYLDKINISKYFTVFYCIGESFSKDVGGSTDSPGASSAQIIIGKIISIQFLWLWYCDHIMCIYRCYSNPWETVNDKDRRKEDQDHRDSCTKVAKAWRPIRIWRMWLEIRVHQDEKSQRSRSMLSWDVPTLAEGEWGKTLLVAQTHWTAWGLWLWCTGWTGGVCVHTLKCITPSLYT